MRQPLKPGGVCKAVGKRSKQVKEASEIHQRVAAEALDLTVTECRSEWGIGCS